MMTKRELTYFKAAKAVSELSDHKHKIGCVVVDKHRIISSGHNSNTKCHALQAKLDMERHGCWCPGKLHAETAALLALRGQDLSRASIYIYREHKDGTYGMSKPCPSCEKLIRQAGIRHIYYTGNNSLIYEQFEYEDVV